MNGTAATAVDGTMARVRLVVIAVLATAIILATPKIAMAANAYGQTFAGQQKCLENCHENTSGGWQVGTYVETNHAKFVTDVQANPGALVPSASSGRHRPTAGATASPPSDVKFMLGDRAIRKQYVMKYPNTGSHLLGSGRHSTRSPVPPTTCSNRWHRVDHRPQPVGEPVQDHRADLLPRLRRLPPPGPDSSRRRGLHARQWRFDDTQHRDLLHGPRHPVRALPRHGQGRRPLQLRRRHRTHEGIARQPGLRPVPRQRHRQGEELHGLRALQQRERLHARQEPV